MNVGRVFLELDALVQHVNRGIDFASGLSLLSQLRFTVGYRVAARFAFHGSLTGNVLVDQNGRNADLVLGPRYEASGRGISVFVWPGLELGLRI